LNRNKLDVFDNQYKGEIKYQKIIKQMNCYSKQIQIFFLTLFLINIFSCSTNKDEKIIPREEFVKIITDLHYADAIISVEGFTNLPTNDSLPAYYHYILDKYNITIKSFNKSLVYYSDNLDDFMAIYDEVISNIDKKIPKKLDDKSIYKIFDLALEDAKIKADPAKWIGSEGRVLWSEYNIQTISNQDSLNKTKFNNKLKYQSLLMLQLELLAYPENNSKNLRMFIKINYKDSSFDLIEKPILKKDSSWTNYQLFIKTDSTKNPKTVECNAFKYDSLIGNKYGMVKNILLKQYPINKDTTLLIKKDLPKDNKNKIKNKTTQIKKVSPTKKIKSHND
jgi:hypothetical protein